MADLEEKAGGQSQTGGGESSGFTESEHKSAMVETQLGPVGAGLPPIPEPSTWDSAYGIDDAVAIAVTPERAMTFWELASAIATGPSGGEVSYRLIRMRLQGEFPTREASWQVPALGRFQDTGLLPGAEYLYVLARVADGEETPLLVTNPIRMPPRRAPKEIPGLLPWSLDLSLLALRKALKGGGSA